MLPKYVVAFQLVLRTLLLTTMTVAASLVYLSFTLDELSRPCVLSRAEKGTSYFCLNEYTNVSEVSHRGALIAIGGGCALVSALLLAPLSQAVFTNFTSFLSKLLPQEEPSKENAFVHQIKISSSS